jgi:uroporphyrinogen-III synthase
LVNELGAQVAGWEILSQPFFRLEAVPFLPVDELAISQAEAWVFPSPFAIEATLARCFEICHSYKKAVPLCAVIGSASLATFHAHLKALGIAPEEISIVCGVRPPYDAEHLAPILATALKPPSNKVVVLVGDKPGTPAEQWYRWLSAAGAESVAVNLVKSYARQDIKPSAATLAAQNLYDKFALPSTVVYFTSIDAVLSMKNRFPSTFQNGAGVGPRALTIHPNISRAVEQHLAWRVVEIEPGTASLINWLQCQK